MLSTQIKENLNVIWLTHEMLFLLAYINSGIENMRKKIKYSV